MSQRIGDFLEWANERGWHLAYYPQDPNYDAEMRWVPYSINQVLAQYFGIDLERLEQETLAMLDYQRKLNEQTRSST